MNPALAPSATLFITILHSFQSVVERNRAHELGYNLLVSFVYFHGVIL